MEGVFKGDDGGPVGCMAADFDRVLNGLGPAEFL